MTKRKNKQTKKLDTVKINDTKLDVMIEQDTSSYTREDSETIVKDIVKKHLEETAKTVSATIPGMNGARIKACNMSKFVRGITLHIDLTEINAENDPDKKKELAEKIINDAFLLGRQYKKESISTKSITTEDIQNAQTENLINEIKIIMETYCDRYEDISALINNFDESKDETTQAIETFDTKREVLQSSPEIDGKYSYKKSVEVYKDDAKKKVEDLNKITKKINSARDNNEVVFRKNINQLKRKYSAYEKSNDDVKKILQETLPAFLENNFDFNDCETKIIEVNKTMQQIKNTYYSYDKKFNLVVDCFHDNTSVLK